MIYLCLARELQITTAETRGKHPAELDYLGNMSGTVAAVLSTFNQPGKLRVALLSVLTQTHPVDEIVVVGDCCSEDTARMLDTLSVPHLRYINLPIRCGEQSIPNGVGTAIANSTFVAYLNQDDLWLPWHIEEALKTLARSRKSWFIGCSGFGDEESEVNGRRVPIFSSRTKPNRSVYESYDMPFTYWEPASAWVFNRQAVEGVGNWKPAWKIARTPVSELPLRLWRKSGEPAHSELISVGKIMGNRLPSNQPLYARPEDLHASLEETITARADAWALDFQWPTKVSAERYSRETNGLSRLPFGRLIRLAMVNVFWLVFKLFGVDSLEFLLRVRNGRGAVLTGLLRRRTGEQGLSHVELSTVLEMLPSNSSGQEK